MCAHHFAASVAIPGSIALRRPLVVPRPLQQLQRRPTKRSLVKMTTDTSAPSASASPLAYDLTPTVLKYVDRHLAFPLLSHMASTEHYKQEDIAKAQYELAKGSE